MRTKIDSNNVNDKKLLDFLAKYNHPSDKIMIGVVLDALEADGFVITKAEQNEKMATPPAKHQIKNPIKYFHIRHRDKQNLAISIATEVHGNEVYIAFAFCSTKDNFCRRTGREMALEKLASNDYYTAQFSGHSADDIARVWPAVEKPHAWDNCILVSSPETGLDYRTVLM